MKLHIFIVIVIVVAMQYSSVDALGEKMDIEGLMKFTKPMKNTCIRKTNVDPALVDAVRGKGEWSTDRKLMCFYRCITILLKVMNKQYELTEKSIETQINLLVLPEVGDRLKAATKHCFEVVEKTDDSCKFAYDLAKCGYETDISVYFLP